MHNGDLIKKLMETVEEKSNKKRQEINGSEFFKIALTRFWALHPETFALNFLQLPEKNRLDILESAMILKAESEMIKAERTLYGTVRCNGNVCGRRCGLRTLNPNGYCHVHQPRTL